METTTASSPPEPTTHAARPDAQQLCPACGGLLIPLRGFGRCARCGLSLCESCEGGAPEDS
jgi:hypothetical protein